MAMNSANSIAFDGRLYRVFEYKPQKICVRGDAYAFPSTDSSFNLLDGMILPCRAKCTNMQFQHMTMPGIYVTESGNRFILPESDQLDLYLDSRIKNAYKDNITQELDMVDMDADISGIVSGDIFQPKIYDQDDMNNKLFKIGASMKRIAKAMFDIRLGKDRYNFERAIRDNRAMSETKMATYSEVFEMQYCKILTDMPGAKHPIGKQVIMFSDAPFEIDFANLITFEEALELLKQRQQSEADNLGDDE